MKILSSFTCTLKGGMRRVGGKLFAEKSDGKKIFDKKILAAAVVLGLCFTLVIQALALEKDVDEVKDSLLRLHIIANSDSEEDQALKIKVRDRLLSEGKLYLGGANDKDGAMLLAKENLGALKSAAEDELKSNGCDLPVTAEVTRSEFSTRIYDGITLPAGEYDALRVTIGRGEGKNWWCVMFPPMCVSAGCEVQSDEEALCGSLSEESAGLVSGGEKYKVKFKAAEIYESVRGAISRLFRNE